MQFRHRHLHEPQLDITAFMNLMIILVPVLLLSMVFTHTKIIELKLPNGHALDNAQVKALNLEVTIKLDRIEVSDSQIGHLQTFPIVGSEYDLLALSTLLQQVKKRVGKNKRDITLLSEPEIDYQTIISVMDTLRSYQTVVVASVVSAELFPEISLGDAPMEQTQAETKNDSA